MSTLFICKNFDADFNALAALLDVDKKEAQESKHTTSWSMTLC